MAASVSGDTARESCRGSIGSGGSIGGDGGGGRGGDGRIRGGGGRRVAIARVKCDCYGDWGALLATSCIHCNVLVCAKFAGDVLDREKKMWRRRRRRWWWRKRRRRRKGAGTDEHRKNLSSVPPCDVAPTRALFQPSQFPGWHAPPPLSLFPLWIALHTAFDTPRAGGGARATLCLVRRGGMGCSRLVPQRHCTAVAPCTLKLNLLCARFYYSTLLLGCYPDSPVQYAYSYSNTSLYQG